MTTTTILGGVAGTLGTALGFGYFFQISKIKERKAADEISYVTFGLLFLNTVAWTACGVASHDWPIIIANVLGMVGAFGILAISYHYNRKNSRSPKTH